MSPIFFQHPSSLIFIHALSLAYFCISPPKKSLLNVSGLVNNKHF